MKEILNVIGKILIFSAILSILVKYGGRLLPIFPSLFTVMVAILTPSLILGIILGHRVIFGEKSQ